MGESILISKDLLDCPLCGEVHELELWSQISRSVLKNEVVEYREHVYKCKNCAEEDNEFVSGKFLDANLQAARDTDKK